MTGPEPCAICGGDHDREACPQCHEAYQTDQPWICWRFLSLDSEIPEEGGQTTVVMDCCICGEKETVVLDVPPIDTPHPPDGWEHPERRKFLDAHVHPLQQTAPETWAKPLRNPAAIGGGILDILTDVAEKAIHETRRQRGEPPDA